MIGQYIVGFARLLRAAGLAVGPDRVLVSLAAVEVVGWQRRDDVRAALAAAMLHAHEHRALFDAAFDLWWAAAADGDAAPTVPASRLQERLAAAIAALRGRMVAAGAREAASPRSSTVGGFTDLETLRHADFASMSVAEFDQAQRLAEGLPLPVDPVTRRRSVPAARPVPGGRLDLRATLRRMARVPHTLQPRWRRPRVEPPPLVVLLDVSGSMERYARVVLHYLHGLARRGVKLHLLTFGTRLTDVTRALRERDPDLAVRGIETLVRDWHGGTRIASALHEFNHRWAGRVLGGSAALLLVTDGLDRDARGDLAAAAARLRRSAHCVVWLNPLLRYAGFEPKAAGVRALLPFVDRLLPVHDLASLADLGRALGVTLRHHGGVSPDPEARYAHVRYAMAT